MVPPSAPYRSSSRKKGNRGKNGSAKGRKLLLAAVCASFTPSTSAFTVVGSLREPAHVVARASSSPQNESSNSSSPPSSKSALSSASPNGDVYFFTAPPQPETKTDTKTISTTDSGMISAEQVELETMEVAEEEDLLSTTAVAAAVSSAAPATVMPALFMDVDGNGTGALMKRSVAAGGVHAPLMATNPSLAFPIDSGKEGLHAESTRSRIRKPLNDGIIDRANPQTRLVRYSLPPLSPSQSKANPVQKNLILAPTSSQKGRSDELARPVSAKPNPRLQPQKPRLVRYNGPDVENSADYDGMELPSIKRSRNRQLKIQRANLVRYNGASLQKLLTEEVPNSNVDDGVKSGTEEDHKQNRKNLVEDPGYANRYTELSDYNLARKTGLAVNKPISLWVERDKFL